MTFVEDGEEVQVEAEIGKSLLEVAHANEIDLEGARAPLRLRRSGAPSRAPCP